MNRAMNTGNLVSANEGLIFKDKGSEPRLIKQWYAVYTVVRHEKTIDSLLSGKNVETFLPLREVVSQWKDRKKRVQLPLFPGYIFVRLSTKGSPDILNVLNTKGVIRILSANGSLQPVPDEEINSIKSLLETKIEFDTYPHYVSGSNVVVINGPLQGITGKIIERNRNNRLFISIDIIKSSVSVEIDPADVELV